MANTPARLGRYELLARIGEGGMAEVHLARQYGARQFEKLVVVKTVHTKLGEVPSLVEALLEEARIAALVKHPNVVDVYDLGEEGGTCFIAMEYLAGESLFTVLKQAQRGPRLDRWSVAQVIADAAAGLHAAHELRDLSGQPLLLVHQDVSPGNVFVLHSGQVKLVDFGVAKIRTSVEDGLVRGKSGYLAPELFEGATADRRSDVFSLGVVMWEALTQRRLYPGNERERVVKARAARVAPPSSVMPDVGKALDDVCLRALARDPAARYATAGAMHDELLAALRACGRAGDHDTIGRFMRSTFADAITAREQLLRDLLGPDAARAGRRPTLPPRPGSPSQPPPSAGPARPSAAMAAVDPGLADSRTAAVFAADLADAIEHAPGQGLEAMRTSEPSPPPSRTHAPTPPPLPAGTPLPGRDLVTTSAIGTPPTPLPAVARAPLPSSGPTLIAAAPPAPVAAVVPAASSSPPAPPAPPAAVAPPAPIAPAPSGPVPVASPPSGPVVAPATASGPTLLAAAPAVASGPTSIAPAASGPVLAPSALAQGGERPPLAHSPVPMIRLASMTGQETAITGPVEPPPTTPATAAPAGADAVADEAPPTPRPMAAPAPWAPAPFDGEFDDELDDSELEARLPPSAAPVLLHRPPPALLHRPEPAPTRPSTAPRWLWPAVGGGVVVLAGVLYLAFGRGGSSSPSRSPEPGASGGAAGVSTRPPAGAGTPGTVGSTGVVRQPGATEPGAATPGSAQVTTEPGATEPGATEPGTTEPGATEPGATEPGTTAGSAPPVGSGPGSAAGPSTPTRVAAGPSAATLYKQGQQSFLIGNNVTAMRAFQGAINRDPRYALAYRGLGLVYDRLGDRARAAKAYRSYLRLSPRAKDAKLIRERLAKLP